MHHGLCIFDSCENISLAMKLTEEKLRGSIYLGEIKKKQQFKNNTFD